MKTFVCLMWVVFCAGCVSSRAMVGTAVSVECSVDTDAFRAECSKEHLGVRVTRQF